MHSQISNVVEFASAVSAVATSGKTADDIDQLSTLASNLAASTSFLEGASALRSLGSAASALGPVVLAVLAVSVTIESIYIACHVRSISRTHQCLKDLKHLRKNIAMADRFTQLLDFTISRKREKKLRRGLKCVHFVGSFFVGAFAVSKDLWRRTKKTKHDDRRPKADRTFVEAWRDPNHLHHQDADEILRALFPREYTKLKNRSDFRLENQIRKKLKMDYC